MRHDHMVSEILVMSVILDLLGFAQRFNAFLIRTFVLLFITGDVCMLCCKILALNPMDG